MGTITSRDTRRISFDNNFAISPPIVTVEKSIEDEATIVFDNLPAEPSRELLYNDNQYIDTQDNNTESDYWSHRIEFLKKEHQTINKIIETEYDKKIESTNQVFQPPKVTHERIQKIKPCIDWRAKILRCYEENPNQPLVCATIVQAFANCVSNCRFDE